MATITLTIPVDKEDQVIHALCVTGGFADDESTANAKQAIMDMIKHATWRVDTQEAEAAVQAPAEDGLVS